MDLAKLIVGVLMGGTSLENEVSFNSGRTICDHLDDKYIVKPIFMTSHKKLYYLPYKFLYRGKIADFEKRLEAEAELIDLNNLANEIDFIYLALHGKSGEDGTIQSLLELLKIPYLGAGVRGSILGMSKKYQYLILNNLGLQTPKTVIFSALEIANNSQKKISFDLPYLVKPAEEGSSIGISYVNNQAELDEALQKASLVSNNNGLSAQDVLVQEYITGREFSCTVITNPQTGQNSVLAITEVIIDAESKFFNYEQKYMPGKCHKITPAQFSKTVTTKIEAACLEIMDSLEIYTIMRIDGFVTPDDNIIFLDVNTIPGTGPTSFLFDQAAERGLTPGQIVNMLIEAELKWNKKKIIKATKKCISITDKYDIAVLLGGSSNEKEISLESGRNVVYKLQQLGYKVCPIFVDDNLDLYVMHQKLLVKNTTQEIAEQLVDQDPISWPELQKFNFVFLALHGGAGENGTIQGALQALGIKFNGSDNLTSAICMDKQITKTVLKAHGLNTINGLIVSKKNYQDELLYQDLKWPLIVKPHDDGCSFFVTLVHNQTELKTALAKLFMHKNYALVEEYIDAMELTIGVIGTAAPVCLPASEVVRGGKILSIEEKFLPGAGENQTPANISAADLEQINKQIVAAYQILNCKNYARIDCFFKKETKELIFIEFNTLPALTPATCLFHQALEVGLKPAEFLQKIIDDALISDLGLTINKELVEQTKLNLN
jgi:D-alanine--D-alanine ligase